MAFVVQPSGCLFAFSFFLADSFRFAAESSNPKVKPKCELRTEHRRPLRLRHGLFGGLPFLTKRRGWTIRIAHCAKHSGVVGSESGKGAKMAVQQRAVG
jgi:hypothetical protein